MHEETWGYVRAVGFEPVIRLMLAPLVFMLAPHSMTDTEYSQWELDIPFTDRVIDESDYEFSGTHLMPSLLALVCVLALLFPPISHHLHSCTLVTLK